ncbi:Uridylate kinase [Frankliniella fusca]|uniref:Uridylate kinase n=1 Tax=Frankliniella fusca TaxID=407009 RepID=A0AAE1HB91_9NEOP|nr:Uridylate kinase [Frankliniella fusca]
MKRCNQRSSLLTRASRPPPAAPPASAHRPTWTTPGPGPMWCPPSEGGGDVAWDLDSDLHLVVSGRGDMRGSSAAGAPGSSSGEQRARAQRAGSVSSPGRRATSPPPPSRPATTAAAEQLGISWRRPRLTRQLSEGQVLLHGAAPASSVTMSPPAHARASGPGLGPGHHHHHRRPLLMHQMSMEAVGSTRESLGHRARRSNTITGTSKPPEGGCGSRQAQGFNPLWQPTASVFHGNRRFADCDPIAQFDRFDPRTTIGLPLEVRAVSRALDFLIPVSEALPQRGTRDSNPQPRVPTRSQNRKRPNAQSHRANGGETCLTSI